MLKARAAIFVLLFALAPATACGGNDDASSDVVTASGTDITERQRDMLDITDHYLAAWSDTDGDAVASFMAPDGYIEYPERDEVYFVSDGTLQQRVSNGPYTTLHAHAPRLVYDDRIVLMGEIDALSLNWLSVIRFTTSGDPLIASETIFL
jgi:hypothetical protein